MKVKSITIKNIGLIENETIEFNKPLLLFYGDIRQGKTTILNAVRWAFGGSFPADIIRHGQNEAIIDIIFDNGSINRSFYVNKEGETTARPQNIVINGRVAKVSDLKQFLNPFLLDQNHLFDMNKKDRSDFIIDLFGVNTIDIDMQITTTAKDASDLRSKIKGYGEIEAVTVDEPKTEALKAKKVELQKTLEVSKKAVDESNLTLKNKWEDDKQKELEEIQKFNKEQDDKIKAITDSKLLLSEIYFKVKDTIFEKYFDQVSAKKAFELLPVALEKKPLISKIEEPEYAKFDDSKLIEIDQKIHESELQQVKYDQYLKDKKRLEEKEADQKTLKELEEKGRNLQKQRIAKLSEINGKIAGLEANENGLFFESTSFDMLSTSQIMNLSSQLSGLYPEGFGLELIDRGESLGKSIFEFVDRATKEQKTIIATIVGERPANVPENIGVFVVDNGKII